MIIVTGGIKGGVGKSTTAVQIAVELVKYYPEQVLLVDADNQGTATDFMNQRKDLHPEKPPLTHIQLAGKAVRTECLTLKSKYDYIIIDAGGTDNLSHRAALSVADLYIIPCEPKSFGVWTFDKVADVISDASMINEGLEAWAYVNLAGVTGDVYRLPDNLAAIEQIENAGLKYADVIVGNRKFVSNANSEGLTVMEVKPKTESDMKAQHEFTTLFQRFFNVKKTSDLKLAGG